ncbi:MAG: hypothetical protein E7404_09060 [Ruminococcaceae bacterium]|nr:hypothetical protein [Oscillospiraceae bacterium]
MKIKKITSLILAACMLVGMFSFNVFALEDAKDAQIVYKASDAWYASGVDQDTNNTYNGNTLWTWERSDNNVRQSLAYYCRLRMGFAMNPKDTGEGKRYSGPAWTTKAAEGTHPAVGEGWMKPMASKTETTYAVSRNFTAPVTGIYEFSTEDGYIYGGSLNPGAAGHRTAFIQITKQDSNSNIQRIWPSDAAIRIPETTTQDYKFEPVQFYVKKGDIIRFVVFNGNDEGTVADEAGTTYCAGKYVYWKPVVTLLKSYSSDESWPETLTNTSTISNNNEIWKFKYSKDGGVTYTDFSLSAGNNTHHYAQPIHKEDGTVDYTTVQSAANYTRVYTDSNDNTNGVNNDATIVMGKWWQAPNNTQTCRVAKVFTAPYSGTIRISAKDESENAKIYVRNNKKQNTAGPKLYIDKKSVNNEAENLWNTEINHTSPSFTAITLTTYDFKEFTANVTAGDEIWFVVSGEKSDNKQTKYVYWNPVVTYVDLPVNVLNEEAPLFKDIENTASLTTFADIVGAGKINVSFDVNTINYTSKNAIMCVAVYDETGILENVALSTSTPIASSGKTTFTINGMEVTDLEGGFIKVFLFDSMDTLYPVSDIGATPIYTTLE